MNVFKIWMHVCIYIIYMYPRMYLTMLDVICSSVIACIYIRSPLYYNPLRPTLTKQLIFINFKQLQAEIRALVWLALKTKRSLIIPNIFGDDSLVTSVGGKYKKQVLWPGFR